MKKTGEKDAYCIIYVVRHGETTANAKKLLQGTSDFPLTETGKKQAQILASELKDIHFDAFFSSDLIRAKHTAEIIALERELAVITTKALRERHFGHFEGKPYEVINNAHKKLLGEYEKMTHEEQMRFKFEPFEESNDELAGRFITFTREIAVAYAGKTVLMVSHGGMMRALLLHLGYGTTAEIGVGAVRNLGYIKLKSDGVDFFIAETAGIIKTSSS